MVAERFICTDGMEQMFMNTWEFCGEHAIIHSCLCSTTIR